MTLYSLIFAINTNARARQPSNDALEYRNFTHRNRIIGDGIGVVFYISEMAIDGIRLKKNRTTVQRILLMKRY